MILGAFNVTLVPEYHYRRRLYLCFCFNYAKPAPNVLKGFFVLEVEDYHKAARPVEVTILKTVIAIEAGRVPNLKDNAGAIVKEPFLVHNVEVLGYLIPEIKGFLY